MKKLIVALALIILPAASLILAQDKPQHESARHTLLLPSDLQWGPAPEGLPPGSQAAVLSGDPGKAGPFVIRAKMPDGYKVPPHWHSIDESITVISGTLRMAHGDKPDESSLQDLPAGAFCNMPARMHHLAIANGETIIQVHGNGPFDITYLNPNDDPRKSK